MSEAYAVRSVDIDERLTGELLALAALVRCNAPTTPMAALLLVVRAAPGSRTASASLLLDSIFMVFVSLSDESFNGPGIEVFTIRRIVHTFAIRVIDRKALMGGPLGDMQQIETKC